MVDIVAGQELALRLRRDSSNGGSLFASHPATPPALHAFTRGKRHATPPIAARSVTMRGSPVLLSYERHPLDGWPLSALLETMFEWLPLRPGSPDGRR